SNATAEHFWLNEGFTVWAERRILKALHGEEAAALAWGIGQRELEEALERFRDKPELTRLRTNLRGIDPDDAFSVVPYEKGARFVVALERAAGEEEFDRFVKAYMKRFRFQSVTTEQFCAFVETVFPGLLAEVDAPAWLDRPGLPDDAPRFVSARLEELSALARAWKTAPPSGDAAMAGWRPDETLVFLRKLPPEFGPEDCARLDAALGLAGRGNYEILTAWLCLAAAGGYEPAFERARLLLRRVGRMKYVRPLYQALGKTPAGRALAREVFAEAAPSYHALTRRAAQAALAQYPA
ncbi:MAG: leukotriene A4 hydrolase C-terminal domain-containing protein, partial [Elusimicrobia bacterium]|nr:leukotriene A4 hydrolase C-terminal domain-containing protein [Elusimicrobiota bacterium]